MYLKRIDKLFYSLAQTTTRGFVPARCLNSTQIGSFCNITISVCKIITPCENQGVCIDNNTVVSGFICQCLSGYSGKRCQVYSRICQSNTCWNNGNQYDFLFIYYTEWSMTDWSLGTCNETSAGSFICHCQTGWTGQYCQTTINHCENVTCLNDGVCKSSLFNYTCQCLGDSYSGSYCEIVNENIETSQMVSKSFGYVAIIMIVLFALSIITMDILKYAFNIDPVRRNVQRKKQKRKKTIRTDIYITRYIYVN